MTTDPDLGMATSIEEPAPFLRPASKVVAGLGNDAHRGLSSVEAAAR